VFEFNSLQNEKRVTKMRVCTFTELKILVKTTIGVFGMVMDMTVLIYLVLAE